MSVRFLCSRDPNSPLFPGIPHADNHPPLPLHHLLPHRRARGTRAGRGTRPPPLRTKWTRRVPHPVLIGHGTRAGRSWEAHRLDRSARQDRPPWGGVHALRLMFCHIEELAESHVRAIVILFKNCRHPTEGLISQRLDTLRDGVWARHALRPAPRAPRRLPPTRTPRRAAVRSDMPPRRRALS